MSSASYDKFPEVAVSGYANHAAQGWPAAVKKVRERLPPAEKTVLVIDCYPGVRLEELAERFFPGLNATLVLNVETARRDERELQSLLAYNLTNDRVFGVISCHQLTDFFDEAKLTALRERVDAISTGLVIVYGSGAALVHDGDILIYADMPRWEIQQRMRRGELGNWGADNQHEDMLRRYKRAYFIEWRVFDRHKTHC